jgi:hypothetical protein
MMSGVNGVHSLMAFLLQQVQPPKTDLVANADRSQLELLLQESRQLNETLLKIEKQLSGRPVDSTLNTATMVIATPPVEGHWPAASVVRDVINSQERQHAFGQWQPDATGDVEAEPFRHQAENVPSVQLPPFSQQLLINKYVPTDDDVAMAQVSSHFGMSGPNLNTVRDIGVSHGEKNSGEVYSRLILISIGVAMIMLMFLTSL